MNPQGFSFPPPPPPPPPTQQHQPQQQYPHNAAFTQYGQNHHGQRGGRGGGGGQFRGRGRGHGNRGGGRGGNFMSSDANRSATYPAATAGYGPMTYLGYPTHPQSNQQTGHSAPHYTSSPSRNFQNPVNGSSFTSPQHYSQPTVHGTPYQQQPGYDTSYAMPSTQRAPAYGQGSPPHQHITPSVQPTMMGPPMRWGFENREHSGSFIGAQHPNQRGPRQFNAYSNQNSTGKHANKRDHSSAFVKPPSVAPRTPAPPPVPSFGNPLPSKPPAPADLSRKPKKKKRKHNQLGLTPKTEEHESSEEEDVDEEARLAVSGAGAGATLQVTYRGRTSTLQSSAEIAAWVEERKKRFPTQAKIEEKKKAMESAKKAREEAQKKQREGRKQATTRARKEQEKHGQKEQPRGSIDPADAAAKAKLKAEKLRRKLIKEEKRIAQAEADAERARKLGEPEPIPTPQEADKVSEFDAQGGSTQSMLAESDFDGVLPGAENGPQSQLRPGNSVHDDLAVSDLASETSDSSDWTSSSGSDLSSSDSDESDGDSAPEQATSRRAGPERVPPPPRDDKKRVCHQFARNGRCQRGKHCKFLHEKPERGPKAKDGEKEGEKQGRKGLLQALFDRQKEEENRKYMETIIWLGENGLLDEDAAQAGSDSSALNNTKSPQDELQEGTGHV
ncbi:hypothetical protein BDW59DRAFT_85559 [Aspergillus cavernicola]|uniref:C3H1-type domain-containing protein n=1 Tax=Aspergillus cavernicola TaxID=176166 RepID=A0ABR4I9T0_9EURO